IRIKQFQVQYQSPPGPEPGQCSSRQERRPPKSRTRLPLSIQVFPGPGNVVTAIGQRLDRENLVNIHPIAAETIGAARQVDAPDPQRLVGHQAPGFIQPLLQVMAPMLQGPGVVQAQALDVEHFQALLAYVGDGHRQVRQLAMGEYVTADELASAPPYLPTID